MSDVTTGRNDLVVSLDGLTDSVSDSVFKSAFRNHPLGVALVTADPGDSPVAMTVSSLSSVSANPPILSFSASELSSSTPVLEESDTVVVHTLGSEHVDLATLGATSGIDRFADTSAWSRLPSGEPRFHAADTWLRGQILNRVRVGGSVVYLVHVIEADVPAQHESAPLVYHNRVWHRLGEDSSIR